VEGTSYRSLPALVSGGGEQLGRRASARGPGRPVAPRRARVAVALPKVMVGSLLQRMTRNGWFRAAVAFRKGDHP
jgi:hypothetical protein